MHLLHSFHHSQIWLQKGDVHELTWVRSLRRSRISHRSCLRPPKKHWVGYCAARGNAMRSFSFCNLGSSGRLCESGCWGDPAHWALWAVLDAYDVFSNYRKSNHNICSWAREQYSIFSGAHHPRHRQFPPLSSPPRCSAKWDLSTRVIVSLGCQSCWNHQIEQAPKSHLLLFFPWTLCWFLCNFPL